MLKICTRINPRLQGRFTSFRQSGGFDIPKKEEQNGPSRNNEKPPLFEKRGSLSREEMNEVFPFEWFQPLNGINGESRETAAVPTFRDNLFLRTAHRGLDPFDVGRYWRMSREKLMDLLPEGPAGDLSRDIISVPSQRTHLGIMLRKPTFDIINTLEHLVGLDRINIRGWYIDGRGGTGKSCVLNYLVCWARMNGWMVIYAPYCEKFRDDRRDIKRSNGGIYMQPELSIEFLEKMCLANSKYFEDIPINKDVYGKKSLDGSDISYQKKLYLPMIRKIVEKETSDPRQQLISINKYLRELVLPSITSVLPEPSNLLELCRFGMENEAYAVQALSELDEQLKVQTKYPLLIVVDEFNRLHAKTSYVSIRYDLTKYNGYIPGVHMSLSRLLGRFNGEEYARGIKIVSTSYRKTMYGSVIPDLVGVERSEIIMVDNFTNHEFFNYVAYMTYAKILFNFPVEKLNYYYMLTQGNGQSARQTLLTLF